MRIDQCNNIGDLRVMAIVCRTYEPGDALSGPSSCSSTFRSRVKVG